MEQQDIVSLTADIVAAHVANNNVAVGDLPTLIHNVHTALAALGLSAPEPEPERKKPAVSVRASVKPDHLVCMACGNKQKMLKRHLAKAHGMTPAEYRAEFSLAADYPMVAPQYAEQRRALAHQIGLGRRTGKRRKRAAAPAAGARKGGRSGAT